MSKKLSLSGQSRKTVEEVFNDLVIPDVEQFHALPGRTASPCKPPFAVLLVLLAESLLDFFFRETPTFFLVHTVPSRIGVFC